MMGGKSNIREQLMGNSPAKLLIFAGLVLAAEGLVLYFRDSSPFVKHLGKLPGDIHIKRESWNLYFPLTTGVIVSIALSLILMLINRFR
jgi:hypothetical protein